MKKIILLITIMLLLVGCGKEAKGPVNDADQENDTTQSSNDAQNNDAADDTATKDQQAVGFSFEYNGVKVPLNVEAAPVVEALGEQTDYFEAASCAFQGLDKFYYYSGFELDTYPLDGVDYISSVVFSDDSVSTVEGIYIGSTLEEIIKAYGENYTEESGLYTYILGETKLTILVENNVAAAITYLAIIEGLQP